MKNKHIKKAQQRLIVLIDNFIAKYNVNSNGYTIKKGNIWFNSDINGIINEYKENKPKHNEYKLIIFITSDKSLSSLLIKHNVKLMKSGVFYKKYVDNKIQINNINNNDDSKDACNNNNNDSHMDSQIIINNDDSKDECIHNPNDIFDANSNIDVDSILFENLRLAVVDEHGNENDSDNNPDEMELMS